MLIKKLYIIFVYFIVNLKKIIINIFTFLIQILLYNFKFDKSWKYTYDHNNVFTMVKKNKIIKNNITTYSGLVIHKTKSHMDKSKNKVEFYSYYKSGDKPNTIDNEYHYKVNGKL